MNPIPGVPVLRRLSAWLALTLGSSLAAQPVITRFPASQTVAVGQSATFTVEATGTAPLAYQWYRGGTAIGGATAPTFSIAAAQPGDAGIYGVAVTDAGGTTRTFVPATRVFSAGANHLLYGKSDGSLWAVGANGVGQLGDGTTVNRLVAARVATGVVAAAAGSSHSAYVRSDGTLWTMGWNLYGQLGDGTTANRLSPVQVATGVAAVTAGTQHTLFVRNDGTLWAMGANQSGQLGDGTGTSRAAPVQVATGVTAAAAGADFSLFLKSDGSLWGMGLNSSSQLGDGTATNRLAPVPIATSVTGIAAGLAHALFVKGDGSLWAMGTNIHGQLGDTVAGNASTPRQIATGVAAASAHGNFSLYLKTDGTLWGLGDATSGQLGGSLNGGYRTTPVLVATRVAAAEAGLSFTVYLRDDDTLWSLGQNIWGQLGDGSTVSRANALPVLTSADTPAVLAVNLPPSITRSPAASTVTAGTPVSLSVEVAGTAPFTYQWHRDGLPINGAVGPQLTVMEFSLAHAGRYSVTVANAVGAVTSEPAELSVRLPLVAEQPAATGRSLTLPATTGGAGRVSWQLSTDGGATWTTVTDGDTYSGATTHLLRIARVTPQNNGHLFRYQVTLDDRTATSSPASIRAFTSPLGMPSGLAVDGSGRLLVADAAAQTVLLVGADLRPVVLAGRTGETGAADGQGGAARLHEPSGFFLAADGTLTLADTSNHTLRTITSGGVVTTLAGRAGSSGTADGDGPGARFNAPSAVAADLAGNFLVADQANHLIRLVTPGGRVITLAGRAGLAGVADGTGEAANFNLPTGLAVRRDPFSWFSWGAGSNGYGTIFVSDQGSHTIRAAQANGQVATYVGLPGSAGFANGFRTNARFNRPTGLAMDGDGSLYVADTGNHVIRRINTSGQVTTVAGTPGVAGLMDGPANQAHFNEPEALAFDAARNLYVADTGNGVIRRISPSGDVRTLLILGAVPTIGTQPASLTVTAGAAATFTIAATGEGTLAYQWRREGVPIAGATQASLTVPATTSSDAGAYSVVVSNEWGAVTSDSATLTVQPASPPSGGGAAGGGGGGGGGSPSLFFLAAGASALLAKRGRREASRRS